MILGHPWFVLVRVHTDGVSKLTMLVEAWYDVLPAVVVGVHWLEMNTLTMQAEGQLGESVTGMMGAERR